jgi:prevent-host-death family protein
MKTAGIFEAKTKLSELCDEVARTGEPVLVTRRGKPLVRIDPIDDRPMTVMERRTVYMAEHASDEANDSGADFEPAERPDDEADFDLEKQ